LILIIYLENILKRYLKLHVKLVRTTKDVDCNNLPVVIIVYGWILEYQMKVIVGFQLPRLIKEYLEKEQLKRS